MGSKYSYNYNAATFKSESLRALRQFRKIVAYGVGIPVISIVSALMVISTGGDTARLLYDFGLTLRLGSQRLVNFAENRITEVFTGQQERRALDHNNWSIILTEGISSEAAFIKVSVGSRKVRMINRTGDVFHTWEDRYSEVWKGTDRVDMRDNSANARSVYPLPNGDLLVQYTGHNVTPYGAGLARLNPDSSVDWVLPRHIHHDIALTPDRRSVYVPYQEVVNAPPILKHQTGPVDVMDEGILKLNAKTGQVEKKISLSDAFARSNVAGAMRSPRFSELSFRGDVYHLNSVEVFGMHAKAFGFAQPSDLLLSLRETSQLAVLNPKRETVTWVLGSGWHKQHAAVPTEHGTIRLFDNLGGYSEHGWHSRVLEFDPATLEIIDVIEKIHGKFFRSRSRGDQHVLANGNRLIVISNAPRVVEVSPKGRVVWSFRPDSDLAKQRISPIADMVGVNQSFVSAVLQRAKEE